MAVTRTDRGEVLGETLMGEMGRRAGAPSICATGPSCNSSRPPAGAGQVHLNATCTGFEQDADGVTARFADGRSARGALLVGADGIRSAVRDALLGPSEPRYAGYFAYRGIARGDFPELPPGRIEFAVGRGAPLGLLRCGPGRVSWFATVNAPAGTPRPWPRTPSRPRRQSGSPAGTPRSRP